jgi:hypothetical protein
MNHDLNEAVDRLTRHISNTAFVVLMLVWLKDSELANDIKQVLEWWPVLIPAVLVVIKIVGEWKAYAKDKRDRADPAAWRKRYGYDE